MRGFYPFFTPRAVLATRRREPASDGTGLYSTSTSLTSADGCTATDPGYYASTGSTEQTPCSPGTMAPQPRTGL